MRLHEFQRLHGYRPVITTNFTRIEIYSIYLALAFLLSTGKQVIDERRGPGQGQSLIHPYAAYQTVITDLLCPLAEVGDAGISRSDSCYAWHDLEGDMRHIIEVSESVSHEIADMKKNSMVSSEDPISISDCWHQATITTAPLNSPTR